MFLNPRTLIALFLFLLFLIGLSYWRATTSLAADLQLQLEEQLVKKTYGVELYSVNDHATKRHLMTRVNSDLSHLCRGHLQILGECTARMLRFKGTVFEEPSAQHVFELSPGDQDLEIGLYYRVQWLTLVGIPAILLLLGCGLVRVFPKPLSKTRQQWLKQLHDAGISARRARQLTVNIDTLSESTQRTLQTLLAQPRIDAESAFQFLQSSRFRQLNQQHIPWLLAALHLFPGELCRALEVAEAPPRLRFDPRTKTVNIHGLDIALPGTPFFYYYWYAIQRCTPGESGWFTNPPVNRADRQNNQPLIDLIEGYGGHGKAATDLREKGLRAKTLDQNRSKIKDELVKILGETLAQPFLFDSERDPRTARNNYRLTLSPSQIDIPAIELTKARQSGHNPLSATA